MCGIAGIVSARRFDPDLLGRMAGTIAHRGPDDEGTWIDVETGVGFAHRRLSIVDLSPQGTSHAFRRRPLRHQLQWRNLQS
jgi:asparagine synthase (glutamine-hydrolysing)